MKIVWMHVIDNLEKFPILEELVTTEVDAVYIQNKHLAGYKIYDLRGINTGYNLCASAVEYILVNPNLTIYPDTDLKYDEPFIVKKLTFMNTLNDEHRVFIKMKYGDLSDIDVGLSC